MRVITVAFAGGVVIAAFIVGIAFFVGPQAFSDEFAKVNIVAVNTALGMFLVCAGLALAVVGYAYGAVTKGEPAPPAIEGVDSDLVKAFAELLKQAGGLGVAIMLLGVILLTGTSLGGAADTASTMTDTTP